MIKITDGANIYEVSRGAYEGIYRLQGFSILEDGVVITADNTEEQSQTELHQEQQSEEQNVAKMQELLEKPIANWNKLEVKEFCEMNSIDISFTKNPGEAKEIIKAFLADVSRTAGITE